MSDTPSAFATDDFPIREIPDVAMWSENYAFTCVDPVNGVGFIAFLGRWWKDPTVWREVVAIGLPGDRVICIKNYGRAATHETASASMLRVIVTEPGKKLRLQYDGPAYEQPRHALIRHGFQPGEAKRCRFDVAFDGVAPVWNMSGHESANAEISGSLHIEQIGTGNGFIALDAERFEISQAFTNRDHSRGPRVMDRFKRHCWAQGYFAEEDLTFSVYAIEMYGTDGFAMSNATLTEGGRRYPAKIEDMELIQGYADGRSPYRFTLSSELGSMEIVLSKTVVSLPTSMVNPFDLHVGSVPGTPSGFTFEEGVLWDWNGKKGMGWSERCFVHEPFYRFSGQAQTAAFRE